MKRVVYKNTNTSFTILFSQDGVPIPLDNVTRITMSFYGSNVVADSAVDSGLFDWLSGAQGEVIFKLGTLNLPGGMSFWATIKVYDLVHPDGQVLINGNGVGRHIDPNDQQNLRVLFLDT